VNLRSLPGVLGPGRADDAGAERLGLDHLGIAS